jgi:hypothetical protein
MEDQDQALAAMAGYTSTEGDAKGDDSVQSRHAIRVPKKTAMESTSTAAQSKKKKRGSSSRAEELGGSEEAQPGPKKKKARLTCSSEEILPEREEDGATSMKDDGDGSKTKSKGNKPLRYILFIGNVLSPPLPLNLTIDRAEWPALAHQKGTSSTLRRAKQSRSISHYAVRSLSLPSFPLQTFTDKKPLLRSPTPTPTQTHPRRYAYLRPKSHVLLALA